VRPQPQAGKKRKPGCCGCGPLSPSLPNPQLSAPIYQVWDELSQPSPTTQTNTTLSLLPVFILAFGCIALFEVVSHEGFNLSNATELLRGAHPRGSNEEYTDSTISHLKAKYRVKQQKVRNRRISSCCLGPRALEVWRVATQDISRRSQRSCQYDTLAEQVGISAVLVDSKDQTCSQAPNKYMCTVYTQWVLSKSSLMCWSLSAVPCKTPVPSP